MKDGHIHSPYCPHGTKDDFEEYIINAIAAGFTEISFTEHLPLPAGFKDPSPTNDSAMDLELFEKYIDDVNEMKIKYKDEIKINLGTEIDYIEGYEYEIRGLLNKYGNQIDDSILSVHMIKVGTGYRCIDYSAEEFGDISDSLGGVNKVYDKYYETVKKALLANLGIYKPCRIGHLNLVRKFNKCYPYDYSNNETLNEILKIIKDNGYELDYNVAGLRVKTCKEAYIAGELLDRVKELGIPMVLGSDSHSAKFVKNYEL